MPVENAFYSNFEPFLLPSEDLSANFLTSAQIKFDHVLDLNEKNIYSHFIVFSRRFITLK